MANCDIKTGKIYGAEEGSLIWWHEDGHLVYNQSESGNRNIGIQQNIFLFWMLATTISLVLHKFLPLIIHLIPMILLGTYVYFSMYEEAWCWKYAHKKIKDLESLIK